MLKLAIEIERKVKQISALELVNIAAAEFYVRDDVEERSNGVLRSVKAIEETKAQLKTKFANLYGDGKIEPKIEMLI